MLRGILGLVVAGIISAFALLLVHGQYVLEGRVVLVLSESRGWGVHIGDLCVAGAWLVAVLALVALLVDRPAARDTATRAGTPQVRQPTS